NIEFLNCGPNVFAYKRYSADGENCYIAAFDRFTRGTDFIISAIEKYLPPDYNILKSAGGYGLLISCKNGR
ncbi:MAG: hypothetical protein IKX78_00690, partial [Clostridia bacterium]|nr:hypothetical protein [Clostridia bacterium]